MSRLTTGETRASKRLQAVEALVRRARELNDKRAPDHQERIAKAAAAVIEHFRDDNGLPADEASLLAQVTDLVRASGSSPEGYTRAIDALADKVSELGNVS